MTAFIIPAFWSSIVASCFCFIPGAFTLLESRAPHDKGKESSALRNALPISTTQLLQRTSVSDNSQQGANWPVATRAACIGCAPCSARGKWDELCRQFCVRCWRMHGGSFELLNTVIALRAVSNLRCLCREIGSKFYFLMKFVHYIL